MPANSAKRRDTRANADTQGQEAVADLPPELEGINPMEPHPYHQNPNAPVDWCFCGQHKSSVLHGGPAAAKAPPHKIKKKTTLRSSQDVAAERAGFNLDEEPIYDPEEQAIADAAVEEIRQRRVMRQREPTTAPILPMEISEVTRQPIDRIPIVDQARELADMLPDGAERDHLLRFAIQTFVAYTTQAYLVETPGS